jgi:CheY-like chemotaxis protein
MNDREQEMLAQLDVLCERVDRLAAQNPTLAPEQGAPVAAREVLHAVNNVITGVFGQAQWTLRRLPASSPRVEPAQALLKAAERASHLTRHIRSIQGQPEVAPLTQDLAHVLRDVTAKLRVLACAQGQPGASDRPGAAAPPVGATAPPRVILVIDDDAMVRSASARVLRSAGYEVLSAASGQEGIASFKQHSDQISVVLLDLSMPNMGGEATLSALSAEGADVRVILSTGHSLDEVRKRVTSDRIVGYLQKPCTAEEILQAVKRSFG